MAISDHLSSDCAVEPGGYREFGQYESQQELLISQACPTCWELVFIQQQCEAIVETWLTQLSPSVKV